MTTDTARALVDIFSTSRVLLMDFDGPVCDVFADRPASEVAEHLRAVLVTVHGQHLPPDVIATGDPLHIFRRVTDIAPNLPPEVDAVLRAAEIRAAATSRPTAGSPELLRAAKGAGRLVAIVSNNSAEAIHAYLDRHRLGRFVDHVQGRDPHDPQLMKPNPYTLVQTLLALGGSPADAVFVGDFESDLEAARSASVRVVAYANKPGKTRRLAAAHAVVDDQGMLIDPARWSAPAPLVPFEGARPYVIGHDEKGL